MELIYVALLLHKSGKEINEENVKKVMDAVGIKADASEIKALIAALDGVDIEKEIKQAAIAASAPSEAKEEAKKEEPKEDPKKAEQAASAGLASLFGVVW